MKIRNLFLLNISLVLLFVLCQFAYADVVKGDNIVLVKDGDGYNFETNSSSSTDYDIQLTSKTGMEGCWSSIDLGFAVSSTARIRGFGANVDLDTQYAVPSITSTWSGYSTIGFPICQLDDGLTLYTRGGNYTNIKVTNIPADEANVTISFQMQNNGSYIFRPQPTTGCYALTTQTLCEEAQQNGQPCMWNWGNEMCEEDTYMQEGGTGGGGMRRVECFELDNNPYCINITVCQWTAATRLCDPDPTDWDPSSTAGIVCNNITGAGFCNSVPFLNTMCSWNSSSSKCIVNNSKSKADLGSLDISCEGIGTNDTLCNLSITTYFKPCEWSGTTCTFNQKGIFGGGGPGFFGDIGTEESCQSMGGAWLTETFKYTDSYNNFKTDTDSWCEMSFGGFSTGITGCDQMCWACEDLVSSAQGNDATQARAVCENSSLGFCQFHEDSGAWNGLGWCDMKMQMMMGGGKSCDSDCAACDFLEDADTKCNASSKGCKWLTDPSGGFGWCEDKSAKYCGNDCFSCYSSSDCTTYGKGTAGACEWDSNMYICKPAGFTGEICFDGMDNDNDGKIDCEDSDCGFDNFCGGKFLDTDNCGQYTSSEQAECTTAGCAWIIDDYDVQHGSPGHCGHPGEQCWMFDDNQTGCINTSGCGWKTAGGGVGMCDVNFSLADQCFGKNDAQCNASNSTCIWQQDRFGGKGHCDFKMFKCHSYHNDIAGCNADNNCSWMVDMMSPEGGHCDPKCFSLTAANCVVDGAGSCELQSGFCEPDSFGGNCPDADGNQTACANNTACTWKPDPYYDNDTANKPDKGWCNGMFEMQMFKGMEGGPPVQLAMDSSYPVSGEPNVPYTDIVFMGLKDNPNSFGFGVGVRSIDNAAVCKDMILSDFSTSGTGRNTTRFYWYLDTDGNASNGCQSDDGAQTGFEFKFKYIGEYTTELVESRVSYQCIGGSFGPAAIALSSWKQEMCQMLGGAMVAVDKEALKRFKELYNDTQNMRIYAVTAGNVTNESSPVDTIGPSYYTPGSFDFRMEDCFAPGQDLDGDGFTSDNDPDCQDFKKYGFIPMEMGPGCADGKDNDNDGLTDCDDESCKYDAFFCGGSLAAIATDKTAPSIVLHKKNIFPDAVKVSITEDKPANASLEFYGQRGTCGAASNINATLTDASFNMYHGFMLDGGSLGYDLTPNRTYAYKMTTYDPSGNLAKSGCINFTTKASADENDCPKCNFTIAPKYDSPAGSNTTNATGNLYFSVDLNSDGDWDIENDTMEYGTQISYKEGKNSTIRYTNLNSTEKWAITIKNIDIIEAMSSQTTSSTERSKPMGNMSDEFKYNESGSSKYIGMGSDKFKRMMQNMGAEEIELTVPMTGNHLWHCQEDNLSNCVDVTSQTGVSRISSDSSSSTWTVPVEFGLGFSVYSTTTVTSSGTSTGGGGGSSTTTAAGGGGISTEPEEDETKKFVYPTLVKGTTRKITVKNVTIIPITKVEFKVLNDLELVTLAVKSFRKQPSKVEETIPNAEVYKFLAIEHVNMKDEDVEDIVIRFKVKKSWLEEKNAEHNEVRLRRYKTSWVTLNTVQESGDSEYVYYKATTLGLSYYAITVPKKEVLEAEEVKEVIEEPAQVEEPTVTPPVTPPVTEKPVEKPSYAWLWWILGIVVVASIIIFMFIRRRESKPQIKKRTRKK